MSTLFIYGRDGKKKNVYKGKKLQDLINEAENAELKTVAMKSAYYNSEREVPADDEDADMWLMAQSLTDGKKIKDLSQIPKQMLNSKDVSLFIKLIK